MPNHKLTLLGHPARKKIQGFLLDNPQFFKDKDDKKRRLAYADGVVAISGWRGIELAEKLYHLDLDSAELLQRFNAMLQGWGYQQVLARSADACAEGHLWMTLAGRHARQALQHQAPRHRHPHPRHLDIWVYQIDGNNRPKEDSPCQNCRQWVRKEFLLVNGTD